MLLLGKAPVHDRPQESIATVVAYHAWASSSTGASWRSTKTGASSSSAILAEMVTHPFHVFI